MKLDKTTSSVSVLGVLVRIVSGITITPGLSGNDLTIAALQDPRLTNPVNQRYRTPNILTSGKFTNGPPGFENGVILTTGLASDAASGSTLAPNQNWGYQQSEPDVCVIPQLSYENVLIDMIFNIPEDMGGIRLNYVFATQDDPLRDSGTKLDSARFSFDGGITGEVTSGSPRVKVPGSVYGLSYSRASDIQVFDYSVTGQHRLTLIVCDQGDGLLDSAILFNVVAIPNPTTATVTVTSTIPGEVTTIQVLTTIAGQVTTVQVPTTLPGQVTTVQVPTTLPGQVTTVQVPATLPGQVTTVQVPTTIAGQATTVQVATTLPGQVTILEVPTTLPGQVTILEVPTTLPGQATTLQIPTTISGQVTTLQIPTTLPGRVTTLQVPTTINGQVTTVRVPITIPGQGTTVQIITTATIERQLPPTTITVPGSTVVSTVAGEVTTILIPGTTLIVKDTDSIALPLATSQPFTSSDALSELTSYISPQSTIAPSSLTVSPRPNPSNLPVIGNFIFSGCLGSSSGYPSFNEIGRDPLMTPQNCAVLAPGRRYIGIYADICYASDTLEATSYTELAQCSLFCPGDNTQFCGGNANPNLASIRPRQRHSRQLLKRDAPPNIFLTLYEFATGLPNTTIVGPGTIAVGPSATALGSSTVVTGSDRVGVPRSSGGTRAAITTVVSGITLTITSVVTTVSYMTVDSENPTALISAELCTTLYYHDCGCSTQITPRVPMTTISVDCNACGYQEANHIALTVPGKLNGFDLFKAISTSSEGFSQLGQVSTFVPGASASLPTAVSSNFKNTLFEPEGGSNSAKTSILGLIVSTALGNVVPISSSSTEVSQLSVSQQTNAPVETQIKASASVGWNGGLSTTKPSSVTVAGTKGMGDKSRTAYLYSIALCASLIVNFLL